MLRSILSSRACADCGYCCRFNAYDAETFTALPLVPSAAREGWYQCTHLAQEGCTLCDEEKPLACRLWPLFLSERDGKFRLMLATDCPACTKEFREKLDALLDGGLLARIRAAAGRDLLPCDYDNAVFVRDLEG